jgi:O-antigen ligase
LVVALVLIATAIFLTMSRGSLFALLAMLLAFFLKAGIRKRMLIPIVMVALPIIFMPESFYERIKEVPTGRGTGRLDILIAGIEVVKHNPVMGVGLENFTIAYDRFAGYAPVFRGRGRAAHNMYLQVWAETGVIGFALFIAAIYYQMKHVRPPPNSRSPGYWEIGVAAGCWGLLVAGFGGNIHWSKEFWLCLILLAVITPRESIGKDPSPTFKGEAHRLRRMEFVS